MAKWVFLTSLVLCFVAPVKQSNAQIIRDHREVPGAAAQWKIAAEEVDSLTFHELYNTVRQKHLATRSSNNLVWENTRPGLGKIIFEDCTRPGEVVYSSDRVAIRFGSSFLIYAPGGKTLDWTGERERGCEFRLIPSRPGFAPVGSKGEGFAIYNIPSNRYLVYKPPVYNPPVFVPVPPEALSLSWQETASGRPPSDVAAHADLIPVELFFNVGTIGDRKIQTVYLTIQNIGNVRTSASQQEMKLTIHGEEVDFVVFQPVAPGGFLRNPVHLKGLIQDCESVVVELDTNRGLKFQVGRGAFANDYVFANDRKTLVARDTNPKLTSVASRCESQRRQ